MRRRGRPPLNSLPVESDLPELIELWQRALSSPYGIAISSKNANALMQKLYHARRECGHTAFHTHRLAWEGDEVFIIPRD